jgi:hypothetical protein
MLTQLGDAVNKMGTAFVQCIERKHKCQDNGEDIKSLNSPDYLKYRRNLAKTKAIKVKLA